MTEYLPYGTWPSPIPPELLVAGVARPTDVHVAEGVTWWSEQRPAEGGRQQLVRCDADGSLHELLPSGWNARTRVHEYGGGAWWVHRGTVFFSNWDDQRLYRLDPANADGRLPGPPVPLTAESPLRHAWRYADHRTTPNGAFVVTVRETHHADGTVRNELVAVPARDATAGEPSVLVTGHDFVASPRVSPDGRRLAWLAWNHPDMPWDATTLWVADLAVDAGGALVASGAVAWAGGPEESLVQPEWAPDGTLFVVSDRSDWWNVYRVDSPGLLTAVCPMDAEVGLPAWEFGQSRYQVGADGRVWFVVERDGSAHLFEVPPGGAPFGRRLDAVAVRTLRLDEASARLVAHAIHATQEDTLVELTVRGPAEARGEVQYRVLRPARDLRLPGAAISRAQRVAVPSAGGRTAHALFFPPAGDGVTGPPGELPPLIVTIHGGPTASGDPQFLLPVQFWTTRGFAVAEVEYGGSTGYGRPYRRLLDGAWGVVDVEDAVATARWLAEQGLVDGARTTIRGASAGGFTALAALATSDVFTAGVSCYGVADLASLTQDTHKFESRYLDRLIGPWPEAEAVYRERSPLHHFDGFDAPLLVLQGLQDEVVPPAQAELIVGALRARGVPCAYVRFADEQHGFRIAANIIRAITAELWFYSRVFGFTPAGEIEPVEIENFGADLRHRDPD
jgi:dipeptidyl aminopeptidase/acylaminoacyl peptidase